MKKMTRDEYMQMYDVVGVAMHVHDVLHRGLEELIYQEAMEMEFAKRGMKVEPQKLIHCYYEGQRMKKYYQADFFWNGLVIEIKSAEQIITEHRAQLFNYLRLTKSKRGLLINFGERSLRTERYIYNEDNDTFVLITRENVDNYVLNKGELPQ